MTIPNLLNYKFPITYRQVGKYRYTRMVDLGRLFVHSVLDSGRSAVLNNINTPLLPFFSLWYTHLSIVSMFETSLL